MNHSVRFCLLGMACLGTVTACAPNLSRRYRNWTEPSYTWLCYKDAPAYCTVEVNSVAVEPAVPIVTPPAAVAHNDITIMGDKAQGMLIQELSKRVPKDANLLLAALGQQFFVTGYSPTGPKPSLPVINETVIVPRTIQKAIYLSSRKIEADVKGQYASINHVASYLDMLEIALYIDSTKAAFNKWENYEPVYTTVTFGKAASTRTFTLNAGATAQSSGSGTVTGGNTNDVTEAVTGANSSTKKNAVTGGNTASMGYAVGPSASAGYNGTLTTEDTPQQRIPDFLGTLRPGRLLVKQLGARGHYIEGNNKALVTFEVMADWAEPMLIVKPGDILYDKLHVPVQLAKLRLPYRLVLYPDVTEDIQVRYEYKFRYRDVIKGSQHLPEAKQKVAYYYGQVGYEDGVVSVSSTKKNACTDNIKDQKSAFVLRKRDFRPVTYRINGSPLGKEPGKDIYFNKHVLDFETPKEALNFIEYLHQLMKVASTDIRGGLLGFQGAVVPTEENFTHLRVRAVEH